MKKVYQIGDIELSMGYKKYNATIIEEIYDEQGLRNRYIARGSVSWELSSTWINLMQWLIEMIDVTVKNKVLNNDKKKSLQDLKQSAENLLIVMNDGCTMVR